MSAHDTVTKADKPDGFVNLHLHGDSGSKLDGLGTSKEYLLEAYRLGQPALAVTDHGSLAGLAPMWNAREYERKEHKLEGLPHIIAGCEFYVVPSTGTLETKEPLYLGDYAEGEQPGRDDVSARGAYTHLTVLAENNVGVRNLFHLNKIASLKGWYKKPRISLELLAEYSEGLIVTTGCPSGEIQTEMRLGHFEKALAYAQKLVDIVGKGNVFVELMDHGMTQDLERKVRRALLELAARLNLPLVATNDCHYATHDQAKSHEEMLAMQTGAKMKELPDYEGGTRFAFEGNGSYYLKSAREMLDIFPEDQFPGAVSNTLLIAERAKFEIKYDPTLRPTVPIPEGYDEDSWLRKECYEGLAKRLPDKVNDQEYIDRLEKELKVLKNKNFSSYFLVVSDMLRWAKFRAEPKIPMGPGRGSAAGALVAFVLDITDADPIRHELIFERFLNPERDSPPDIDIDIADRDRERLIEYVIDAYGFDQVAQVITYGTIGAKSALKDVARIYDYPIPTSDALTKALPGPVFGKEITLAQVYDPNAARYSEAEDFRELVKRERLQDIVEPALKLEGRVRSYGKHAAAVIISNQDLADHIPVALLKDGERPITQWDYPTAEAMGLIKMDFLGLRNLAIIQDAVANVKKTRGIDIDVEELALGPMNDPKTYEMLQKGDSLGVFQLDGGPMRSLMKMLKPTEFDDISALVALYRPGPMGVNAHTDYALRKNGLQEPKPIHPEFAETLKEILGGTHQLIVYQEQVMTIAQKVAGYSLAEADTLRRIMGKKKKYELDKAYETFQPRAVANGYSPEAVQTLWDVLVPFADYAFNRSHSVAYGITSYITAYLKANYPTEYMAALLTSVSDNKDKTAEYLEDCRQHGIKVLPPNVNKSFVDYAPVRPGEISFGFRAIKGVGEKVAQEIVDFREANGPFTSYVDYLQRAPKTAVNKRILEALASSGGFDDFDLSRRAILTSMEGTLKQHAANNRKRAKIASASEIVDLFAGFDDLDEKSLSAAEKRALKTVRTTEVDNLQIDPLPEFGKLEKLKIERDFLGLYVSAHPLDGLDLNGLSTVTIRQLLPGEAALLEDGTEGEPEPPAIKPQEGWTPKGAIPHQIAGIVTVMQSRITKTKHEKMAILTVEDKSGRSIEVTVFPRVFEKYGEFLKPDGIYQISGFSRYGMNGEDINFNADAIRPLEFSDAGIMSVRVKVTEKQWLRGQNVFMDLLSRYPAVGDQNTNIIVSIRNDGGDIWEETIDVAVNNSPALTQEIRALFGGLAIGRWRKPRPGLVAAE